MFVNVIVQVPDVAPSLYDTGILMLSVLLPGDENIPVTKLPPKVPALSATGQPVWLLGHAAVLQVW